jgi:hypothetical protein
LMITLAVSMMCLPLSVYSWEIITSKGGNSK